MGFSNASSILAINYEGYTMAMDKYYLYSQNISLYNYYGDDLDDNVKPWRNKKQVILEEAEKNLKNKIVLSVKMTTEK